jgi:hypothetical protein
MSEQGKAFPAVWHPTLQPNKWQMLSIVIFSFLGEFHDLLQYEGVFSLYFRHSN